MNEIPMVFQRTNCSLFGILRTVHKYGDLVILIPAETGSRIGPQRLYVEIARSLLKINISSLCVDFPKNGDGYDNEFPRFTGSYKEALINHYSFYIDIIIEDLKGKYNFDNIILLSISVGCMPVLHYAKKNKFAQVVLLSPNHLENKNAINKKNLRSYYLKLYDVNTWRKFLSFKINFRKVIKNIFIPKIPIRSIKNSFFEGENSLEKYPVLRILNILGEKDHYLISCQNFWKDFTMNKSSYSYQEQIVDGADHSFFGWHFKKDVSKTINDWMGKQDRI